MYGERPLRKLGLRASSLTVLSTLLPARLGFGTKLLHLLYLLVRQDAQKLSTETTTHNGELGLSGRHSGGGITDGTGSAVSFFECRGRILKNFLVFAYLVPLYLGLVVMGFSKRFELIYLIVAQVELAKHSPVHETRPTRSAEPAASRPERRSIWVRFLYKTLQCHWSAEDN
jgi:hypothetical protein